MHCTCKGCPLVCVNIHRHHANSLVSRWLIMSMFLLMTRLLMRAGSWEMAQPVTTWSSNWSCCWYSFESINLWQPLMTRKLTKQVKCSLRWACYKLLQMLLARHKGWATAMRLNASRRDCWWKSYSYNAAVLFPAQCQWCTSATFVEQSITSA